MEKKYIVELYDENVKSVGGYDWLQLLISVADKSVMVETAIQLLPCTEPDFDAIRIGAYDEGYKDAIAKISSDEQSIAEKAYQSGLSDAWEAARKICLNESEGGLSSITVHNIFNTEHYRDALRDYTPAKAIEKIRQYEQKQEQIQVGDEVIVDSGKCVVLAVDKNGFPAKLLEPDGYTLTLTTDVKLPKTGRHYPQIAEVLAKMKEES